MRDVDIQPKILTFHQKLFFVYIQTCEQNWIQKNRGMSYHQKKEVPQLTPAPEWVHSRNPQESSSTCWGQETPENTGCWWSSWGIPSRHHRFLLPWLGWCLDGPMTKPSHLWGPMAHWAWCVLLVGGWALPPLKNDGVSSSDGMMTFPTYGQIIQMFQTTKQFFTYLK